MNARELSIFLSTLSEDDEKILFDLLQNEANDFIEVTLPDKPLSCPICGCVEYVVKNGKRNSFQRYLCKKCNKSFMANTNTILERTHKPLETWKKFIECMVHGISVLKTAEVCEINKNTAFVWRHKVLDALSQLSNKTELNGIVGKPTKLFSSFLIRDKRKIFHGKQRKGLHPQKNEVFQMSKYVFHVDLIELEMSYQR